MFTNTRATTTAMATMLDEDEVLTQNSRGGELSKSDYWSRLVLKQNKISIEGIQNLKRKFKEREKYTKQQT